MIFRELEIVGPDERPTYKPRLLKRGLNMKQINTKYYRNS